MNRPFADLCSTCHNFSDECPAGCTKLRRTKPIYALGIDPGSNKSGWALLSVSPWVPSVVWACGGMMRSDEPSERLGAVVASAGTSCSALVCVEQPAMIPHRGPAGFTIAREIGKSLRHVQRWCDVSKSMGVPLLEVRPCDVRRSLGTNAKGGQSPDQRLRAVLPLHVAGLPVRINAHVRDAAAVAIVGARMWWAEQMQIATTLAGARDALAAIAEQKGAA